eukprot:6197884-Pleurochrysis_carterae.AAC.1
MSMMFKLLKYRARWWLVRCGAGSSGAWKGDAAITTFFNPIVQHLVVPGVMQKVLNGDRCARNFTFTIACDFEKRI